MSTYTSNFLLTPLARCLEAEQVGVVEPQCFAGQYDMAFKSMTPRFGETIIQVMIGRPAG